MLVLFVLSKLIGNKQIGELNMFDYINGITIGSIAAEMATSLDTDVFKPLLAMTLFGVVGLVMAIVTNKSVKARRLITGKALVLYDKNQIYRENLKTAKLDVNEFLGQLRAQGYFALGDVETVFLEANGKVSILPKAEKRPCTPADLALPVPKDRPEVNVIIDGEILSKNLKFLGNNTEWLEKKLKNAKIKLSDVFLATVNNDNEITFYKKEQKKIENDIFQ